MIAPWHEFRDVVNVLVWPPARSRLLRLRCAWALLRNEPAAVQFVVNARDEEGQPIHMAFVGVRVPTDPAVATAIPEHLR